MSVHTGTVAATGDASIPVDLAAARTLQPAVDVGVTAVQTVGLARRLVAERSVVQLLAEQPRIEHSLLGQEAVVQAVGTLVAQLPGLAVANSLVEAAGAAATAWQLAAAAWQLAAAA